MAAREFPAAVDHDRFNSFTVFGGSLSKNVEYEDTVGVFGTLFTYNSVKSSSVGVVRLDEPMSPVSNYFEIEIVEKGSRTALGLGIGTNTYSMAAMPGWNSYAIGYHADDGNLFHASGSGRNFGPTCTKGDVMGCGIDFVTDCGAGYCKVWFTKNGKRVGDPQRMQRPLHGYYPLIGMHSKGEAVRYLGHSYRELECDSEIMEFGKSPRATWMRCSGVRFRDGNVVIYDGNSNPDRDVGVAIASFFLTPVLHYFELTIEEEGRNCEVGIGVVCKDYPLTKFPGWCKQSVGYHSDNGELYKESGSGTQFGPKCTAGDVMGCGIKFFHPYYGEDVQVHTSSTALTEEEGEQEVVDHDDDDSEIDSYDEEDYYPMPEKFKAVKQKEVSTAQRPTCIVYFTKNGKWVGETEMSIPKGGFYPMVGVLSPGEKIAVNLHPLTG